MGIHSDDGIGACTGGLPRMMTVASPVAPQPRLSMGTRPRSPTAEQVLQQPPSLSPHWPCNKFIRYYATVLPRAPLPTVCRERPYPPADALTLVEHRARPTLTR